MKKCFADTTEDLVMKRDKLGRLIEELDLDLVLEDIDDIAERNIESVIRINRIIKSTKRMAHFEDEFTDCDLNTIVNDAVTLTHNQVKYDMAIEVDLAEGLPRFQGMPQELGQVFINLIINACQALTDVNQAVEIKTSYEQKNGRVTIQVKDQGRGMKEEVLGRVMEPFFTTRQSSGGTGLGVSISYGIVREHGGTMEYKSEPSKRTTVTIALPVAKDKQDH